MALRAVRPEVVAESKPKFMISGKSGVGKTWFALSFKDVYFIDTEGGAERQQYRKKLMESDGVYLGKEHGSQDFNIVIEELRALATTKHSYKTLVIDSFTKLYNVAAAIAEEKIGSDFGKDKKEANRPTRQLMRWIDKLDMVVILICHQKDKWERKSGQPEYAGTTFDGFEKLEYELDLWIEIQKKNANARFMVIKKSRIDAFPEGEIFEADYEKFSALYGKAIIEKEAQVVEMATPEQLATIADMRKTLILDSNFEEKVFKKFTVDSLEELKKDQAQAVIDGLNKKLAEIGKGGK